MIINSIGQSVSTLVPLQQSIGTVVVLIRQILCPLGALLVFHSRRPEIFDGSSPARLPVSFYINSSAENVAVET